MSKKIINLLIILACPVWSLAQSTEPFTIKSVALEKNTVDTPTLTLVLNLDLENGTVDPGSFGPANLPSVHVNYNGKKPVCPLETNFTVGRHSIRVRIKNLSQETLDRFAEKDKGISIHFDTDVKFGYLDNSVAPAAKNSGIITKEEINKKIDDELSFPAEDKAEFATAINNMYYYKNNIDFGVQTANDSSSVSYTVNFNYQNLYSAPSLLTCQPGSAKKSSVLVYYGISTRLSTNAKDSLNFWKIYPLIIHSSNYTGRVPYELNFKLGHESNQTFTTRRVAVDGAYSLIIPNLINLSSSSSTRLRLKPVIDLGIKGYYDYSKSISAFTSGQAYVNGYYYIPVLDHYAIILTNKTFYDFSTERNPHKKLLSNYSVTLGTEVPKTAMKVMFKYENGKSDINYKQSQALVIGLIMNLFSEQKNK